MIVSAVLVAILVCSGWWLCGGCASGGTLVKSEAKVYTEPSVESRVVCTLHRGERVTALDSKETQGMKWCLVETPKCVFGKSSQGWVRAAYLEETQQTSKR